MTVAPLGPHGIVVLSGGADGVRAAHAACRLSAPTRDLSLDVDPPLARVLAERGVLFLPYTAGRYVVLDAVDPVRWYDSQEESPAPPEAACERGPGSWEPVVLLDAAQGRWAACNATTFPSLEQARSAAVEARQHMLLDLAESEPVVCFLDPLQDHLRDSDLDGWGSKYDTLARQFGMTPPERYREYASTLPPTEQAQRNRAAAIERKVQVEALGRRALVRWENAPPRPTGVRVQPDPRVAVTAFVSTEQAATVIGAVGHLFAPATVPSEPPGQVALLLHHLPVPTTIDHLTSRLYAALRAIEEAAEVGAVDSVRWPDRS